MKITHRRTGDVLREVDGDSLYRANLQGANLQRANLQGANLQGANLQDADLQDANLLGAYLSRANLLGADLRDADLRGADLRGAVLSNTILDPMAPPNGYSDAFERDGDWCIGYRTQNSPHSGGPGYSVGEVYEAPVFSVSSMECHPGIFVLPTVAAAAEWLDDPDDPIVKVIFRAHDCHRAGAKWRVRWLIVWEEVER